MKEDNLVKLFTSHTRVFERGVEPECGDGWFDLIDTACQLVEHRLGDKPDVVFKLLQIKEKFGTMSIYYSGGDDYIKGVLNYAMSMSAMICEISGDVGSLHRTETGWIRTVSPKVAEEQGMVPCRLLDL